VGARKGHHPAVRQWEQFVLPKASAESPITVLVVSNTPLLDARPLPHDQPPSFVDCKLGIPTK
jgi:hypothetical protein